MPRGRVSLAFATVPPCSSTRSVASSPRRLAYKDTVSTHIGGGDVRAYSDLSPEKRDDNRRKGHGNEDNKLRQHARQYERRVFTLKSAPLRSCETIMISSGRHARKRGANLTPSASSMRPRRPEQCFQRQMH